MKNIVILISGNGSNMQAIIDKVKDGLIDGRITAVISNQPDVYGLTRAKNASIPALVVNHKDYPDRTSFEKQLISVIDQYKPDLVVLAGFMRILGSDLVQHYLGRMLNIHPSLLPKYKGLNTHRRVLESGDSLHGTSVHFVTAELDGGPVIAQKTVKVKADDTEQTLQQKIQQQEHILYPQVIGWFCDGSLSLVQGKVINTNHS